MRILCIGNDFKESADYVIAKFTDVSKDIFPAIFDFDVVILDLPTNILAYQIIHNRRDEFAELLRSRGICFVISNIGSRHIVNKPDVGNYSWCPFDIYAKNKSGTTVFCESEKAKWLFDAINFNWQCYFKNYPEDTSILATNRAGHPISIIVPYENGHCVFLPYTNQIDELTSLLIQSGLNIISEAFETEEAPAEVPTWIGEFVTEEEEKLLKKQNELEKKIRKRTKFKRLLYEKGIALQELVEDIFKELGFDVKKLPKGAYADLEIPLNGTTGAIEVTGLEGSINVRKARQLLHYCVDQEIERDVKGILVVNHYQNISPKERGDVATEDAIALANKFNFCILPTTELYNLLEGFWDNKVTKEDVLKILNRVGLKTKSKSK